MTTSFPTRFANLSELSTLPWFDMKDGRLVLSDETVGPTIDCHSHLALSYVLPNRVDYKKLHEKTETYLPDDRAIDLDIYVNCNLSAADVKRLKKDLTLRSMTAGGMRATHTQANISREMQELNIAASVLLPIDYPVLSRNARNYLAAAKGRSDLISFGSVHPYRREAEREIDTQIGLGARGVKFHPACQLVAPDHPRSMKLYDHCGKRATPVLLHCGPVGIEPKKGRELSQVARYKEPLEQCKKTTFVLGHSGALQMEEALALAQNNENAWLEISCQSVSNLRRIFAEGPTDRIVFGSDWPFYPQAIGIAKVLIATEDRPELRRKVLYENAARLLRIGKPAEIAVPA